MSTRIETLEAEIERLRTEEALVSRLAKAKAAARKSPSEKNIEALKTVKEEVRAERAKTRQGSGD